MTREIKFRAWDVEDRKMLGPKSIYELEADDGGAAIGGRYLTFKDYPDGKLPLMQYTGLKDKNGVEIYEGDILQHSYKAIGKIEPHIRRFKVVFNNGQFTQYEPGDADDVYDLWYEWNELSVIGNIYENPELLSDN